MSKRVLIGVLGVLAVAGFLPTAAEAGTYPVVACQSDGRAFRTHAFTDFATRGMRIRRACRSGAPSLRRGLIAANVVRRGGVTRNARAVLTLRAPAGMQFSTLEWSARVRRTDCNYEMEVAATGPARAVALTKTIAGKRCPRRGRAQTSGLVGDGSRGIAGTDRIVVRVLCKAGRGRRCSARRANFVSLGRLEAKVQDVQAPSVTITGGDLVSGRWVRGNQPVTYVANDGAGVQQAAVLLSGAKVGDKSLPCDNSRPVPCPGGPDSIVPNSERVRDGTHQTVVVATDAAGNATASAPVLARLDNTAPLQVPISAQGGDAWRSSNAFGATWSNPPEGDAAPIDGAIYRVCRAGGDCQTPQTSTSSTTALSSVQVPAPGEWRLQMWRRDQAGNAEERNASNPVTLRYDPEAPNLALAPVNTMDPTLVGAPVTDPLSGVATGQIEISRAGTGTWQSLATKLAGERLEARVDDAAFPPGRYLLRASAADRAGNTRVTDKRADGSVAVVDLPLRLEANLSAGFVRSKTVRRVVRRKGKRRVVRRKISVLRQQARARYGRAVPVTGRLLTKDARALAGSLIYVFSRGGDGVERFAGTATTDAAGRYRYMVRAGANQQLKLYYLGAPSVRPAIKVIDLEVPARTAFRVSDRRLLNGQSVTFGGRLAVPPTGMAAGKLVELQTKLSGRWQTFRTVRTDAQGRWRSAYRFRRTRGLIRYRFRARLPREGSYPFATGTTRSVRVTVRGR